MPEFGEIYVCRFPFTSGTFSKPRPVLVLFDLEVDVLICRITSVLYSGRLDVISFVIGWPAFGDTRKRIIGRLVPLASQHATPSESNPAPQTRATVKAVGVSSGEPTSNSELADPIWRDD
jgi:hypothetical protein